MAGIDYTVPDNLTGMIQAGSTEDSLTISIVDNDDSDGNKIFTVRLKTLNNAVFASGTTLDATVTVLDDEFPTLSFKTTEFNPAEEIMDGEFEVEVEISMVAREIVTFDIELGGGTATKRF